MGGEVISIRADISTKQGVVEFYEKCVKLIDKVNLVLEQPLPVIMLILIS